MRNIRREQTEIALALKRDSSAPIRKPAPVRRIAAAVGAVLFQLLALAIFIDLGGQGASEEGAEAVSFNWLYLSPLAPPETPPEVELPAPPEPNVQMPRVVIQTPEEFDPYAVRIEDLRLVSVPTVQIIRYNGDQGGGTAIRLGLGSYFSCDVASYDTLSDDERENCAERMEALRQQRDLLNPNGLLFALTADELRQWNRWESESGGDQGGLLLPCMNAGGFLTVNFDTIDCVAENLSEGQTPENNQQSPPAGGTE